MTCFECIVLAMRRSRGICITAEGRLLRRAASPGMSFLETCHCAYVVPAGEGRAACPQLCRCPLVLVDDWRPLLVTLRGLIGQVLEFCSRAAGRQGSSRRRRRAPTRSGPPAATAGRRRPLSTNRSVVLAFVSALIIYRMSKQTTAGRMHIWTEALSEHRPGSRLQASSRPMHCCPGPPTAGCVTIDCASAFRVACHRHCAAAAAAAGAGVVPGAPRRGRQVEGAPRQRQRRQQRRRRRPVAVAAAHRGAAAARCRSFRPGVWGNSII